MNRRACVPRLEAIHADHTWFGRKTAAMWWVFSRIHDVSVVDVVRLSGDERGRNRRRPPRRHP